MSQRILDVCLSPALYSYYARPDSTVVMIDAIRASASICTALMNGAKAVLPFSDKDEAYKMREKGCVIAGERNGEAIAGFDFGNSPGNFTPENIRGKDLAFTTTNGTRALNTAADFDAPVEEILVGSFLNISALTQYLITQANGDVVILCSGWKNSVNIEDSYFAGVLVKKLTEVGNFFSQEAARLVEFYAQAYRESAFETVMSLSPRLEGKSNRLEADFRYCLQNDLTDIIPVFREGRITPFQ